MDCRVRRFSPITLVRYERYLSVLTYPPMVVPVFMRELDSL